MYIHSVTVLLHERIGIVEFFIHNCLNPYAHTTPVIKSPCDKFCFYLIKITLSLYKTFQQVTIECSLPIFAYLLSISFCRHSWKYSTQKISKCMHVFVLHKKELLHCIVKIQGSLGMFLTKPWDECTSNNKIVETV